MEQTLKSRFVSRGLTFGYALGNRQHEDACRGVHISTKQLVGTLEIYRAKLQKRSFSIDFRRPDITLRKPKTFKNIKERIPAYAVIHIAFAFAVVSFLLMSSFTGNQESFVSGGYGDGASSDEMIASTYASDIARHANLAVASHVEQRLETQEAQVALSTVNEAYLRKPYVVTTQEETVNDVKNYVVQEGDSLDKLSERFNVTSDTIRWANDIAPWEELSAGEKLTIPPVSGVLHKVADSDTPESLADKFNANAQQIIAFNDAEVDGLNSGQMVMIPGGKKEDPVRNTQPTTTYAASNISYPIYGSNYNVLPHPGTFSNGFAYGYCTYYAAYKAAGYVPPRGNANQWDDYAAAAGRLSSTPRVGAIFQTDAGWAGHVGVVEAVSADGTKIKYSDMNGLAGWNRVGITTDWVPASSYKYIY